MAAAADIRTKTLARQSASKFCGLAAGVFAKCFVSELVKFACFYVPLDLPIPVNRVKLAKPSPKLRQLVVRKSGDRLFQRSQFAHALEHTIFLSQVLSEARMCFNSSG